MREGMDIVYKCCFMHFLHFLQKKMTKACFSGKKTLANCPRRTFGDWALCEVEKQP